MAQEEGTKRLIEEICVGHSQRKASWRIRKCTCLGTEHLREGTTNRDKGRVSVRIETAASNTPVRKEACSRHLLCASILGYVGSHDHHSDSLQLGEDTEGLNNVPVANSITDLTKEGGIRSGPGKTAVASTDTMLAWGGLESWANPWAEGKDEQNQED